MLKQTQHNRTSRESDLFSKKLTFLKMLIGKHQDNDPPLNYNELVTRFLSKTKNK